jgi:arginine/lysine/histidine/glutamine transport system substrate-binding/permease protein
MLHLTRTQFFRRWLPGLLGFVGALVFAACGILPDNQTVSTPPSPTDAATPAAPVLRIAVDPAFPPFEMKASDGTLTGFDIDLINAIGGTAGFLIDFDEMSFDDVIRRLYGGEVDAAISAITVNRDRSEKVSFSRPYFKSGLGIAVPADNTDLTSLESLRGKRIGVQRSTTSEVKALTIPDAEILQLNTAPDALQALAKGQIDAVINDAPATDYAIRNGVVSGIKQVGGLLSEEFYGIATPKNSPYLEQINAGLTTLLNNGTYAQLYQKWFAAEPPALPEVAPI